MSGDARALRPPAMLLRLALFGVGAILLEGAVAVALIEAWRSPGRLLFLGVVTLGAAIAYVALVADTVRRTAVLQRSRARLGGERIPPSPSALRDALRAPERVAGALAVVGVVAATYEVASGGALSGEQGAELWSAAYAWAGLSLLAWTPLSSLVRGGMLAWLRPYDPREIERAHDGGLAARLAADVLLTVVGVLVSGGAVYLGLSAEGARMPPWLGILLGGAALAFLVVFVFVVWRARAVDRALLSLARHAAEHRPGALFSAPAGAVPGLSESLVRLQGRLAEGLKKEASSRDQATGSRVAVDAGLARFAHDLRTPVLAAAALAREMGDAGTGRGPGAPGDAIAAHVREALARIDHVLGAAARDAGAAALARGKPLEPRAPLDAGDRGPHKAR